MVTFFIISLCEIIFLLYSYYCNMNDSIIFSLYIFNVNIPTVINWIPIISLILNLVKNSIILHFNNR